MSLEIELKARVLSCRGYERNNKKRFFVNILHKDDVGSETVFPALSDVEVMPTAGEVDVVLQIASYKKAEGFLDKQTGQPRASMRDTVFFTLAG